MTALDDLIPRWFVLPHAAVAVGLVALGLSYRATGTMSDACIALGAVYGGTVGLFLWRRPYRRSRSSSTLLLGTLVFAPLLSPLLFLLWPASVISRRLVLSQKGELMHPEEQPLLLLREDAKDGDVWVLSDQAIYVGLKTRDRRPGWRIRRDDVLDASHAAMGDLVVVTLRIDGDMEPTRVVTGCFNPFGQEREVRKLLKELGSPSTS